jgi:hypothetical protein
MLLALGKAARLLLDDDVQLEFTAAECVEVKQKHMACSIQAWWRYHTARRASTVQGTVPCSRKGRWAEACTMPVLHPDDPQFEEKLLARIDCTRHRHQNAAARLRPLRQELSDIEQPHEARRPPRHRRRGCRYALGHRESRRSRR